MKNQFLTIALISVVIGIIVGILFILLLQIWRRDQVPNSLIKHQDIIGLVATVEIPFDQRSKGKVFINIKGSQISFSALTDQPHNFQKGERVLIWKIEGNQVWVETSNSN